MINEREQRRHSCVLVDIVTKRHWKIYIRNLKQSSKITQFVHVCSILHVQIPIKKAQYHWPDHCLYPNIQCMSTMLTLVPSVPLSQSFQKTNEIVSVFFGRGGGCRAFEFISSGFDTDTISSENSPVNLSSIAVFKF